MKTKLNKPKIKKTMLSIELSKEESKIMHTLKDKYAINISQLVKNVLREYLKKVEKINVHLNI